MRALVVYESMFGNTHHVADAIGEGLRSAYEVTVVPVHDATPEVLHGVTMLVVGGPTHVHGMTSDRSRHGAADLAAKDDNDLELEPDALGEGLRDWFEHLATMKGVPAAAFDTRVGTVGPALSGRASKDIAKRLRQHGLPLMVEPESFLVDKETHLMAGELERAREWGAQLAGRSVTRAG